MLNNRWRKSTRSNTNGSCVEARLGDGHQVQVRDTKLGGQSPILAFPGTAWANLLGAIAAGNLDLPAA